MKPIHVQLAITLDDDAIKTLADLLAPALRQAMELPEARLRASQHAHFGGQKPPEDKGLLIDSRQAAKLLKVSERTLWKMHTTGEMLAPIRIGRAVRWSLEALKKWIEAGCPPATMHP